MVKVLDKFEKANQELAVAEVLNNLEFGIAAGLDIDTDMAVAGILTTAKIIACWSLATGAASGSGIIDLTAQTVILTDGNIQVTTDDQTGLDIMILYYNVSRKL